MLLKLIASLLLLAMMSCAAVNPINTDAKLSNRHDRTIANTTLVLKDHIYEIQQNTSIIKFRVDIPFGEVWGSFHDFEGSFTMLNNGANNQSAVVNINTESLHVDRTFPYPEHITVKAETTIKRSEFGIYTLLPAISDNVNLFMNIDALKKNTTVSMM